MWNPKSRYYRAGRIMAEWREDDGVTLWRSLGGEWEHAGEAELLPGGKLSVSDQQAPGVVIPTAEELDAIMRIWM